VQLPISMVNLGILTRGSRPKSAALVSLLGYLKESAKSNVMGIDDLR